MAAAVAGLAAKPAVVWREVRCRKCGAVLTRYRVLPGWQAVGRAPATEQEFVCPDRRCRTAQTVIVRLSADDVVT